MSTTLHKILEYTESLNLPEGEYLKIAKALKNAFDEKENTSNIISFGNLQEPPVIIKLSNSTYFDFTAEVVVPIVTMEKIELEAANVTLLENMDFAFTIRYIKNDEVVNEQAYNHNVYLLSLMQDFEFQTIEFKLNNFTMEFEMKTYLQNFVKSQNSIFEINDIPKTFNPIYDAITFYKRVTFHIFDTISRWVRNSYLD
jgi:hypothetical protein